MTKYVKIKHKDYTGVYEITKVVYWHGRGLVFKLRRETGGLSYLALSEWNTGNWVVVE